MFSFDCNAQHFPVRIVVWVILLWFGSHHSLVSQVRDNPLEKNAEIAYMEPFYSTVENEALKGYRVDLGSHMANHNGRITFAQSELLKRRIKVEVSNGFEDRTMNLIVRRFAELLSKQLKNAKSPTQRLFFRSVPHITLGTSGIAEREGFWQAHLQRADYELISSGLSLNDINRFQFRKNRKNGDTLPKRSVAEGGKISITD